MVRAKQAKRTANLIRVATSAKKDNNNMTPQVLTLNTEVFDLSTFEEVAITKSVEFTPVQSVEEALALVGNDPNKLLASINEGFKADAIQAMKTSLEGFHTFNEDGTVNGPFTGAAANKQIVNKLVNELAITIFKKVKTMTPAEKNAAKDKAKNLIQTTPVMLEGLKEAAAITAIVD